MIRATDLAHQMIRERVQPGDWVVDATVGNGHDTQFLAALVGQAGHVFGFDIQEAALSNAKTRLRDAPHVTFFHTGHEQMAEHLPEEAKESVRAIMFNLGYLPGADKGVITQPDTTLKALRLSLDLLAPGGIITLVLYVGHQGGAAEAEAIIGFANSLSSPFNAGKFKRLNTERPAPMLLVIERAQ